MPTLLDLFAAQVAQRPEGVALRSKKHGVWSGTSWRAWDEQSRAFARALVARDVAPGESVAILLGTREEAVIAEMGAHLAGAVPVPIYPTMTPDQIAFIVADSGARTVVVEDAATYRTITRAAGWPGARVAITVRPSLAGESPAESIAFRAFLAEGRASSSTDEVLAARARAVRDDDVASIFYTSGTSGEPKGVLLTHRNFVFEVDAVGETFGISASDEQLLFLPLAHIFGKILVVAAMRVGATTAFAQSMLSALADAEEVRPTFFGSVPRLFEKVHQVALSKAHEAGAVQSRIFDWALGIGHDVAARRRAGREVPLGLEMQQRYADKLVLSKIRARFGGRVRFAISGAAPLDRALFEWFHAVGLVIYEGYGLTETTGATNVNRPQAFRFGTVGRPLPGVEVKVDEDGEVLTRGQNVMRGYHNHPGSAVDEEGWFHTGDIGRIDDDGFLTITDRKKDLLITAGGKNVAPQRIEALVARDAAIARVVVLGDRRPYLVALVVLEEGRSRDDAQRAIDAANAQLAPYETIKAFAVLERDLSVTRGELTPTFKVRRRAVEAAHRATIDAMYRASVAPQS